MGVLEITVTKWDDYNPRKDQKAASWYRFDNRFPLDPKFFEFSNDQKMVWIYILSECSVRMEGKMKMNESLCAAILRIDPKLVSSTLQRYESLNLITIVRDVLDESSDSEDLAESPNIDCTGREQRGNTDCTGREQTTYPSGS